MTALKKRIKELLAENIKLKAELSIARGKMQNLNHRKSMTNLHASVLHNIEPSDSFADFTNKSNGKQNPALLSSLGGPQRIDRGRSFHSLLDVNRDPGYVSRPESPSVSLSEKQIASDLAFVEQQIADENDEFMEQIAQLNEELQKEVKSSQALQEKLDEQNLELDKAEESINKLTSDTAEKSARLEEADTQIAKLKKQLKEYKKKVKDYRRSYPNHNTSSKIIITPDTSDIDGDDDGSGTLNIPPLGMRSNSMQIAVGQMENYMKTLGTTKKDLDVFTDNITDNLTVLPEIRAEFAEKHEKATEFYGDIKQQQKSLQSEMSSMKKLLENMSKNYDANMSQLQKQMSYSHQTLTSLQYANSMSDGSDEENRDRAMSPYDMNNITERSNQTMINIPTTIQEEKNNMKPLIESDTKPKSWFASLCYCGGDNENQIGREYDIDRQIDDRRSTNRYQNGGHYQNQ